ncbi:hypothetical protein C4588_04300 [Candidatus Parcubacteria bacterium]|jgi:hypothetical protein|nr:MAG: hypothetical protein C4588_04300 [Candidatus Parcubacteria bacterium]
MSKCTIRADRGGLIVRTPYNAGFIAVIKSLPVPARRYNPIDKSWIIDPQYGSQIANWIAQHFGELITVPPISDTPRVETQILEVRYIGKCKFREDGQRSAFGWANGEWSVIFPEQTLRNWFEGFASAKQSRTTMTLYSILGIKQTTDIDVIKTAYRRMAKQWHPDICREPDAAERFIRIQEAYQILSDPNKRARYDAGLALETSMVKKTDYVITDYGIDDYSPPLRCGYILVEGHEVIGRFVADKILAWEDITDAHGRTLVTSWPKDAQTFIENWI